MKLVDPDGRDVTFAPVFFDALLAGVKASNTLALLYHKLRYDPRIKWNIKPDSSAKPGARAYSTVRVAGAVNGERIFVVDTFIPLRKSPRTTAGLIAHEGAHAHEALLTGETLEKRYLGGERGTVWPNALAGPHAYESSYAQDIEESVLSEYKISQSSGSTTIIDALSDDLLGDTAALFEFGGELYIDGINLTGVMSAWAF